MPQQHREMANMTDCFRAIAVLRYSCKIHLWNRNAKCVYNFCEISLHFSVLSIAGKLCVSRLMFRSCFSFIFRFLFIYHGIVCVE